MSGLKFGTSGLRGLVTELTDDICAAYTTAFLSHMQKAGWLKPGSLVLIGQDLRSSSPRIAAACMQAAGAFGAIAENCGALPTPALALRSLALKAPAIMVTGSHIPADRNGLKFYRSDGEIDKQDEAAINAEMTMVPRGGATAPATAVSLAALGEYTRRCLSILPPDSLKGKRIGIYQHSSVARDFMMDLITGLGGSPIGISRSDTFVPVDTEALRPEDVEIATSAAQDHHFDALISTDGDADRPLVADENGAFLRGDALGLLTAKFLKADAVVTPVTSSTSIELSGLFKSVVRTKVGSPYVIAGMEQAKSAGAKVIVGFEANGGVLLGSDADAGQGVVSALPTRDAMLPILAVLGLAVASGKPVSALRTTMPDRHTASGRLEHIGAEKSGPFLAMLADRAMAANYLHDAGDIDFQDHIDGMRFVLRNGEVIHYRASGNAPELRCYAEAGTAEAAGALVIWGLQAAAKAL